MEMFGQELQKCMKKSHILLVTLLLLVIAGCYKIWMEPANIYVDVKIEEKKAQYMQLMDRLEGAWTEETSCYFEEIEDKLSKERNEIAKAGELEVSGTLSKENYWQIVKKNGEYRELNEKFELIQDQKAYVEEDVQNRFFLYENGWNQFFGNRSINYWLLFLLILNVPVIFCRDYETDMYRINRVTRYGNAKYYFCKIGVGMFLSCLFTILFWLEDLVVCHIRFGLGQWNVPIQSLSIFKACKWKVSIGFGAVISLLLTLLGACFFSTILMLFSVLLRKSLYAIVITVVICILPIYMEITKWLCNLPLPTAYLDEQGFLLGYPSDQGDKIMYTMPQVLERILCSGFVMFLCVMLGYFLYQQKNIVKILIRTVKRSCFLPLLGVILTMTSCGVNEKAGESTYFDTITFGEFFVSDAGIISASQNKYSIYNEKNRTDLFQDPFFLEQEKETITLLNVQGNKLYYRKNKEYSEYEVIELDLYSGESKSLYKKNTVSANGQDYLNIVSEHAGNMRDIIKEATGGCAWVDGELYYHIENQNLMQYNIRNKSDKVILNQIAEESISYANGYLLYINNKDYNIWMYNVNTGDNEKISEQSCLKMKAFQNCFYYQTANGALYRITPETNKVTKVQNYLNGMFSWMDEKYVYSMDGNYIYRYEYKDGKAADKYKINETITSMATLRPEGEIYLNVINPDSTFRVEIVGSECFKQ